MQKLGKSLIAALCTTALLVACTDQPAEPTDAPLFKNDGKPWATNWGDPLIGPIFDSYQADPSCMGENVWAEGSWTLYGKVTETPSGNTIVNGKVWWDPADNRYINLDNEVTTYWLAMQQQTWNWYTRHNADGVEYQYANTTQQWVNDQTGRKVKGYAQVQFVWLPGELDPQVSFKKFGFKCH